MARGSKKNISLETKQHVVHLYYNRHYKQADIARDLRICLRSVENILADYRRGSHGLRERARVPGRPRILEAANVDVRLLYFISYYLTLS
jgi:transposase-like protein